MTLSSPRVAVGPTSPSFALDAVRLGGGTPVAAGEDADALIWLSQGNLDGLRGALHEQPGLRWVQLPFAGVEQMFQAGIVDDQRVWTCGKGSYGDAVAEHALALALAGLRMLPDRARSQHWGNPGGTSLYGAEVTILGAGGIAAALLRLLEPFEARATVVRRHLEPTAGAWRTLTTEHLHPALSGALVVFVALALTPQTEGIIGTGELAAMGERAWLVNVARGRHVRTDDLVAALEDRRIAGAALDVTDPEPLPDGHPLWKSPNCIITPHTTPWDMVEPRLAQRIRANTARFAAGEPLEGTVDLTAGY